MFYRHQSEANGYLGMTKMHHFWLITCLFQQDCINDIKESFSFVMLMYKLISLETNYGKSLVHSEAIGFDLM